MISQATKRQSSADGRGFSFVWTRTPFASSHVVQLLLLLGLSALFIDFDDFRQAVCEGVLLSLLLLYVSVILILARCVR